MARKRKALELPITPIPSSPCRDCAARSLGCHSGCGQYAAFRVLCDEEAAERMRQSDVNDYVGEVMKRMPGKRHL